MRYLGISVMLLAVLFLSSEYKKRCELASCEMYEFLSFLKYMRHRIACCMEDKRRLGHGFCAKVPALSEFVLHIDECSGPHGAYLLVKDRMSFSEEGREMLSEIFASAESGYLDEVLSSLDDGILKFGELCQVEKEALSVRSRLVRCVLITLAVGAALLLS